MRVVALYSIKGGVGKTTAAVNLSYEAAHAGARVLLWDLDPQGAATFFFRVRPKVKGGAEAMISRRDELGVHVKQSDVDGLNLVPADFSLRNLDLELDAAKRSTDRLARLLAPLDDEYDVVILDCAPGISLSSEAVFVASDVLAVPTIPTTLSVRTLDQLDRFLPSGGGTVEASPEVAPFVSMFDRRKALHRELVESLAGHRPPFLPTAIPNASAVERMGVQRLPLGEFAPHTQAAVAFRSLWADLAARLW